MTKLDALKQSIGYRKYPSSCVNCVHFSCDLITHPVEGWRGEWHERKNQRCNLARFATKPRAWCNNHEFVEGK